MDGEFARLPPDVVQLVRHFMRSEDGNLHGKWYIVEVGGTIGGADGIDSPGLQETGSFELLGPGLGVRGELARGAGSLTPMACSSQGTTALLGRSGSVDLRISEVWMRNGGQDRLSMELFVPNKLSLEAGQLGLRPVFEGDSHFDGRGIVGS